jgi:[ribosomal protein S5]-alanine N-acetyltransferase
MIALQTARLTSRPVRVTDAAALFSAYASDCLAARYMTWRVPRDVTETERYLVAMEALMAQGNRRVLALAEQTAPDKPIGVIDARFDQHRVEVGYVLGRAYWGRGLMTEALSAAVAWAHTTPHLHRLWAVCDVDNRASARVMEKSGLVFEGVLRRWAMHPNIADVPRDCACYAATW